MVFCAKRVSPSAQEPGAPTLDSEMGAAREGATGVPGERTWLAGVGYRSRPSTLADALLRPNHPHSRRVLCCGMWANLDHHICG
jgi:hypothetical protein